MNVQIEVVAGDITRQRVDVVVNAANSTLFGGGDNKVRVTGKKRDDLQNIISYLKESSTELPLQYINFRD